MSITGATSVWGIDRVDQGTGRDGQYSIGSEGAGVNIYVVDTGLNMPHTDFTGRVAASWTAINDGMGANDCNGHGTHTAGTAAGTTYGIAKKANIIPVRVVECDGSGWNSTAIAGVDWAVAHHKAGQPAVMNMSIGGFVSDSFDQAVKSAIDDGITVVAAAGNNGVDACGASPARITTAITVAATDINDNQAAWSDYGSCVDIQAPGVSIRSAWNNSPTGFKNLSGTSMAAPHVSGAAAVLLSRNRALSPADVHRILINNSTPGVVGANKGLTPNRFLYIPGKPPPPPNCATLKPGDAWAGVGTYCGLGKSATNPSTGSTGARTDSTATGDVAGGPPGGILSHEAPVPVPTAEPVDGAQRTAAPAPQAAVESGAEQSPAPAVPVKRQDSEDNSVIGPEAAAAPVLPDETGDATVAAVPRELTAGAGASKASQVGSSVVWSIAVGLMFCASALYLILNRITPSGTSTAP
ncbi:S8 family serine peptidase [Paenarthrobacter sp. C1]|uniref:S8 family peptidase n=1 Tax=Paenarthrobacter sp. C1 TaxID=3400220 RepID=UPI003BF4A9A5